MGPALLLVLAGVAGCSRGQPGTAPASPATPGTTQSRTGSFWASGWTYHLCPLKADMPAEAEKIKEVWRDLFAGMAKDPKTRQLLTRLHGGWPTEFLVLDAKQIENKDNLKAPPPDGFSVVLRVADLALKEEKSNAGPVPVREIAYGRAIEIKDAVIAASLDQLAAGLAKEPMPGESLDLAMQDYLLRHAPGWAVRDGPVSASDNENLPASVEVQCRELDQKIEAYAARAKAHYGAPRWAD